MNALRLLSLFTAAALGLAGCAVPPPSPQSGSTTASTGAVPDALEGRARTFVEVVDRVEPVAEQVCRARAPGSDCDFVILVDDRPGVPANAFQTLDRRGRPVVVVTAPLIADARNPDELAFILGHEAAHHIAGHIPRARTNAQIGAMILGGIAEAAGQNRQAIDEAARLGATVGSRRYAKEFELEADALGTLIAERAGFDAIRGAQFFARIPDPGDRFLGTHPPNAARQELVRRTALSVR